MEKILVVEDEKSVRNNLEELLSFEGYECEAVENGLVALNFLTKKKPDLIISDIMMPYVDGYQLYEKVKSNFDTHIIPFIFLTAKIDHDSRRLGMGMGADDYITKPYTIKELLSAVKTRLNKKKLIENSLENLRTNIAMYVPHELRTPLVSILGYSDLLIQEFDAMSSEQAIEMIKDIKNSGLRLHERIEKFVLYVQIKTDENLTQKIVSSSEQFLNPNELDCTTEFMECHDCAPRKNDISWKFEDTFLSISESHLKVILKELVSNACKFSSNNSEIQITGKNINQKYVIQVSDWGCGIPIHSVEAIKAFEQFDRKKYQQVGNGLGLSIVKLLCNRYQIDFEIESIPGKLTNVKLIFNTGTVHN